MDRIFSEIKKAIEDEMRNAESGPPPGGGRPQGGGRRAQEYAEWLKEEQGRLRGDGAERRVSQPKPLEETPVETKGEEARRTREQRQRPRERQPRDRQPRDRSGQSPQPRDDSGQSRQRQQQPSQRQRSESRQRGQPASASSGSVPNAVDLRRRTQRLLSSPGGLRQAFILREIVSKPVSLRDKDDHLIT